MQMDTSRNGTNLQHKCSPSHRLSHIWLQGLCHCSLCIFHLYIYIYTALYYDAGQFKNLFYISPASVGIMSVIGRILGPSMTLRIQVGNAVCWPKPCSMFLLKTGLSFGKLHVFLRIFLEHSWLISALNGAQRYTDKQANVPFSRL